MGDIYTRIPGLLLKTHRFEVPLDYSKPKGDALSIFAREVVAPGNEEQDLPWIVFFQGGPGFGAPRPFGADGWLKRATKDHKVLLLDQRGTGCSTPITHETLSEAGTPKQQADYLKHLRGDNIVRDAEFIRKKLIGAKRWKGLGQSFGGFCMTSYLSLAPHGLSAALITGGLPPLVKQPDEVYRRLYKRVIDKNVQYYRRYPEDAKTVRHIVTVLQEQDVRLPGGERLTDRRFLQLGILFGFSDGFENVHYLLEQAFNGPPGKLSYQFLRKFETLLDFNSCPIYAILHESIYCQGQASKWSAERLMADFKEAFSTQRESLLFTGEMVFPWMFSEYSCLTPMRETAELIADFEKWPALYDEAALAKNLVPTAAAVYFDDMYVDFDLSIECLRKINGARAWITNEFEHNGIRSDGERVLDRLLSMVKGDV